MNSKRRLLINLFILAVLASGGFAIYRMFSSNGHDELRIRETENNIQSIRTIAEISTVTYRDEVVVDSAEYHSGESSIINPLDWYRMYTHEVKRRLTLIIKGELRYGLDLTDSNFSIENTDDSLLIHLPEPKLLDVSLTPNKTEVYNEQGKWRDSERKALELKGRSKLIDNAERLGLKEKARKNAEELIHSMLKTDKNIRIEFE